MKYLYTIIVVILTIPGFIFAQVTVEKIPGLPGGNFTSIVEFSDTLYTSSFSSEVFFSADNGANWELDRRFPLSWIAEDDLGRGSFLVADTIRDQLYIGGATGLTIYSSSGVSQPETIPEFFGTRGTFGDILVADSALFASYNYSFSSRGEIVVSTDNGVTWTTHDATNRLLKHLVSSDDGMVLGAEGDDLLMSESGVTSFTELALPNQQNSIITDIQILDSDIYVSTSADGIFQSSDNGSTWNNVLDSGTLSLTVLENGNILAGGADGNSFLSSDKGENWTETVLGVEASFYSHGISDVLELSDGTLVASIYWEYLLNPSFDLPSPGIISSNDGGSTWSASNSGLTAQPILQTFYDSETDNLYLYANGAGVYQWDELTGRWFTVGDADNLNVSEYYFVVDNETMGWAPVGLNSGVQLGKNPTSGEMWLVTEDYTLALDAESNNWSFVDHDPHDFLLPASLSFFEDGTAFVHESLGPFQGVYTTSNASTWTKIEGFPNPVNITNFTAGEGVLAYFDNYAFDQDVGIHYSSDLGTTWNYIQENRNGTYFPTGYFLDSSNGKIYTAMQVYDPELRVVIEEHTIGNDVTNDIEVTFNESLNVPAPRSIYKLPNGTFIIQMNQTLNRNPQHDGYYYSNEDIYSKIDHPVLNSGKADEINIVGDNKILFRYGSELYVFTLDGSDVGTSSEAYISETPSNFQLYPNYPNPFNPTTNLNFGLAEAANTKITVYSILGEVVKEINLGVKSAGYHQFTLDASSLSSGVYLYRIQANNDIKTAKMTLIK
ncbi:MAG: T9SS type A sorting domain-containing protein [Gracilimonas sp.]|nr:T9SS type A sorting domain-containing protein [Gracilimonas sp.]